MFSATTHITSVWQISSDSIAKSGLKVSTIRRKLNPDAGTIRRVGYNIRKRRLLRHPDGVEHFLTKLLRPIGGLANLRKACYTSA